MDGIWNEVVAEALNRGLETSDGAVPGAKLRELVARIGPKHGVSYPLPGREDEKFADFLKQFSSSVIVLRREGFQPVFVVNGARAMEVFHRTRPDRDRAGRWRVPDHICKPVTVSIAPD